MPLLHSKSPEAFKANVGTLMRDVGKSPHVGSRRQALAIAYATKRRAGGKYAEGGPVRDTPIRDAAHLNRLIAGADGDEALQRIKRRAEKQGLDTTAVPAFAGYAEGGGVNPFIGMPSWNSGQSPPPPATKEQIEQMKAARAAKASGGPTAPFETRMAARGLLHAGQINSLVPGRTDKLPITVGGGAYVLPADHMAALGQGNSAAGANIMNKMLKMGPYGSAGSTLRGMRATAPKLSLNAISPRQPHLAPGGAPHGRHGVPIIAAGGEFVIPPEKVREIGGGDIDRGHRILDHWVVSTRKKHIKTLRNLKPPKQD